MTNINLLTDLKLARKLQADGVGLYRTEFPFLIRSSFPTEENNLSFAGNWLKACKKRKEPLEPYSKQ